MKNVFLISLFLVLFASTLFCQIEATFNYNTEGQRVCLVEVSVTNNPPTATLHFLDANLNNNHPTAVYRRNLYGAGADWTLQVSNLPPGTSSWTDTNVNAGEVWEYQVRRTNNNGDALGYATAGIYYDQSNYKGQLLLLISNNLPIALPNEINRLKKDLTGDGWYVKELFVDEGNRDLDDGAAVVQVKNAITTVFNDAPTNDKPKVLFVLGNVPLPRSGQGLQSPDGHIESTGARGSDSYYADIDGIFTDTATYDIPQQGISLIKNFPGDFRWDQDLIPTELELAFGRVSFLNATTGIDADETASMKQYLDRLHDYRHVNSGTKIGTKTGFNETGYSNSTDASYRCLPALSGTNNIAPSGITMQEGHNQWVADNGPLMWYMSNQHIPSLLEWDTVGMDALVYSSDQSNFGYGDTPNYGANNPWQASTIRRLLSYDSKCLITLWTTSAINVFQQAGVGEPLGVSCKYIMDHNTTNQNYEKVAQNWDEPAWWNRTHFNFFGDPSLRLYQTFPPSDLQVSTNSTGFTLEWTASIDQDLVGYHVFKSDSEFGKYQRITGAAPIANTSFVDPFYQYGDWYMVRAVAEEASGSGVFLHPSQGVFVQGQLASSENILSLNVIVAVTPNPASDWLHVSSEKAMDRLEIWDASGRLVLEEKMTGWSNAEIAIQDLPKGTYYLKVYGGRAIGKAGFVKI